MKYSEQEVLQFVQEEDIKFIRLAFCDVFGRQKNISIMPRQLARAFSEGIVLDASAVRGFGGAPHTDLFLRPDPDTLAILPWRPEHGKVVRMFCTITYPDGTPYENDTRGILIRAIEAARQTGYRFYFGSKMEFYLFKQDENGDPTRIPSDRAGYMDIAPADKGENVRREICLTLEQMGISPETSHHEEGPGQNEIDYRYADALTAADNAMAYATVVQAVATRNGLCADFSPKPLENHPGNGFHINLSVKADGVAASLSPLIAGILDKSAEMTAFMNPEDASYLRLGGSKTPGVISWSRESRSALVRIPAATGEYRRLEFRSPDPAANPYLAFALLIYAALTGLEAQLPLPPAADTQDARTQCEHLPMSLAAAKALAAASPFIAKCLPQTLIACYCK